MRFGKFPFTYEYFFIKTISIHNNVITLYLLTDQAYNKAIELYSAAIEVNPTAIYYANRSFAYLKTEAIGYALNDASKAIELDQTYTKAYYRRAAAYMSLGKFKLALRDYEAVSIIHEIHSLPWY